MKLKSEIKSLWDRYEDGLTADKASDDDLTALDIFLEDLESGSIRAAEKTGDDVTSWESNEWVKEGILLNFALRKTEPRQYGGVTYYDVLPLRRTDDLGKRGTRNTPDGTTVRRGVYMGEDCIMMSPSFINIGTHIGDETLIDSCDTIGSCAQIGSNVKIGANSLIGGVLEPVEDSPVVVEEGVSLGAGCRVTSGFKIGANSVIGENTLLSPRIPVFDLVENETIYGRIPSERRAFARYVESSVSEKDIIPGNAYKPAVVLTNIEKKTLDSIEQEKTLRE